MSANQTESNYPSYKIDLDNIEQNQLSQAHATNTHNL